MTAFREAGYAIMSNARCLTEGVDVPAVDVVAFLAPRKSKVDIVQAAGRAMRKPDPKDTGYVKETGYILLPLFLETHENESLQDAVKRTDFEDAWDVLQAMQEQDGVLAEIIREMREERGRVGGFDDRRLRERVEVLGPEVSLDALRNAISTAIVDWLGVTWDERYGELKRYKEQYGHCDVPANSKGEFRSLAHWVRKQRTNQAEGYLSEERKARLDELEFDWKPHESSWERMFNALKRYKDRFDHCNVPDKWDENPELAAWVSTQRMFKKRGKLSPDRVERLQSLGFVWDVREAKWLAMLAELKRYKERFGDCNVPINWKDNPQLARWVSKQRDRQRAGTLSAERTARLNAIGFVWNLVKRF
jgi:hypothetical protein